MAKKEQKTRHAPLLVGKKGEKMRKIDTGLGREIDAALEELYALYDRKVIDWFAGLWDGEIGGFYYSVSARDHEGFLPDIESTGQALGALSSICDTSRFGSLDNALTDEIKKAVGAFAASLEGEDGYFYHPQWGRDIGTGRRGRDLDWAVSNARRFGARLPYPTALERLSSTGDRTGLPAHLSSPEALVGYLDRLDIESHSHNKGHVLNSQKEQIIAAGLADTLFDYLDALQERIQKRLIARGERPNGLFQEGANYVAISGLFKLGAIYNMQKRPFRYAEHMIDSGIAAILSDEIPEVVIYVFNPWSGLTAAVQNMEMACELYGAEHDLDAVRAKIRAAAPEMIRKTVKKLSAFRRPDCAFSYTPSGSAPYTQGTHVSIGVDEGEVNGTVLAINGVSRSIFACLGVPRPPIYDCDDVEYLVKKMSVARTPKKLPVPEQYKDDPPVRK